MALPAHEAEDDGPPPDTPAAGHRVGSQIGCGAGAVPVIAAIVCAGLTLVRCLGPTVNSSPPPPATRVAITGSVVLGRGGESVLYTTDAPCRQPVLTAAESATEVSLTLTESDAGLGSCKLGLPPVFTPGSTVDLTLATALGPRRLVDATTGRTIPFLTEDGALRPRMPLAGWSTGPIDDPFHEVSTTMPYFGGPGSAVLVEHFTAVAKPGADAADQIFVIQVARGGWHPPPGTAQRPVTVRGRAGVAAAGIVVWSEAGHTVAVLGTLGVAVTGPPSGPPIFARMVGGPLPAPAPMPTDRLLAFAATLIGGGS